MQYVKLFEQYVQEKRPDFATPEHTSEEKLEQLLALEPGDIKQNYSDLHVGSFDDYDVYKVDIGHTNHAFVIVSHSGQKHVVIMQEGEGTPLKTDKNFSHFISAGDHFRQLIQVIADSYGMSFDELYDNVAANIGWRKLMK